MYNINLEKILDYTFMRSNGSGRGKGCPAENFVLSGKKNRSRD